MLDSHGRRAAQAEDAGLGGRLGPGLLQPGLVGWLVGWWGMTSVIFHQNKQTNKQKNKQDSENDDEIWAWPFPPITPLLLLPVVRVRPHTSSSTKLKTMMISGHRLLLITPPAPLERLYSPPITPLLLPVVRVHHRLEDGREAAAADLQRVALPQGGQELRGLRVGGGLFYFM